MALSYTAYRAESLDEIIERIDKLSFRDLMTVIAANLFTTSEYGITPRYEGGTPTPNAMMHFALALRLKKEFSLDVMEPNLNSPRLTDEVSE